MYFTMICFLAILDFDNSSSKLLEASFNIIKKEDVAAKSNQLIEAMSAMRNFLDTADNKKLISMEIHYHRKYVFRVIYKKDKVHGLNFVQTMFIVNNTGNGITSIGIVMVSLLVTELIQYNIQLVNAVFKFELRTSICQVRYFSYLYQPFEQNR